MPLRRVDAKFASDAAIGILVPPGTRTLVVVRPRGMMWDLLPVRWDGDPTTPPAFVSFGREEAALVARRLAKSLEDFDREKTCPLATLGREPSFQVWLQGGEFHWLLCQRNPGAAYQPLIFATLTEAEAAANSLIPLLHPGPVRVQDYYFNTQSFS